MKPSCFPSEHAKGGPHILVGAGGKRTTCWPPVLRHEWNTYRVPVDSIRQLMQELDSA
jgi:hypothetical protein